VSYGFEKPVVCVQQRLEICASIIGCSKCQSFKIGIVCSGCPILQLSFAGLFLCLCQFYIIDTDAQAQVCIVDTCGF